MMVGERVIGAIIPSGTTTDRATRNSPCRILSDGNVRPSWICIQLWYADTQCADDQYATDTGKSATDFDGGQWQVFQQPLLLPLLQGVSRSPLWCFWWLMSQALRKQKRELRQVVEAADAADEEV